MDAFRYIGAFVCHQIPERSLILDYKLVFFCARCSGIYTGFLIAAVYQWALSLKDKNKILWFNPGFILFFAWAAMVGMVGEKLGLLLLSNQIRLAVGLLGGAALGLLIFPLFSYFFSRCGGEICRLSMRYYMGMIVLLCTVYFMQYSGAGFVLFSVASVAGLLMMYLMINLCVGSVLLNWQEKRPSVVYAVCLTILVVSAVMGEFLLLNKVH